MIGEVASRKRKENGSVYSERELGNLRKPRDQRGWSAVDRRGQSHGPQARSCRVLWGKRTAFGTYSREQWTAIESCASFLTAHWGCASYLDLWPSALLPTW